MDPDLTDRVDAFHVLWFTGAAKVIEQYGQGALERIDPRLAQAIRSYGPTAARRDYLDATAVRMDLGVAWAPSTTASTLLLTPTMPIPAFGPARTQPGGLADRRCGPRGRPTPTRST